MEGIISGNFDITLQINIPVMFKDEYQTYIKKQWILKNNIQRNYFIKTINKITPISLQRLEQEEFYRASIVALFEISFSGYYVPEGYVVNLKDLKYKVINERQRDRQVISFQLFGDYYQAILQKNGFDSDNYLFKLLPFDRYYFIFEQIPYDLPYDITWSVVKNCPTFTEKIKTKPDKDLSPTKIKSEIEKYYNSDFTVVVNPKPDDFNKNTLIPMIRPVNNFIIKFSDKDNLDEDQKRKFYYFYQIHTL